MPRRLSNERWGVVIPYLDHALALSDEERPGWLASLRLKDTVLADDVAALLEKRRALEQEGFLESASLSTPRPSLAGRTVGAYTLRSSIGQGGMGSVWRAERSDGRFEGVAAVKLLNASLVGHQGEERFQREGSILARLRHPHIAQLIDAGLSGFGPPYLVLEYVDGERIDAWCDARRLSVEARVRLFLDVLAAVAHAHANLVVHRDLKPSNVLVASGGQVKLLDFGIAKLLESEGGADAIALTREGESVLTPEYAAPEQLTGSPITTATDVYALGVLLYLLLAGQHPAGASAGSAAELVRAIVDTEPPRLSDAVTAVADKGTIRAAQRATTVRKLRSALKGDLDTIVAKALKKEPSERYVSAEAMADDLRRFLDGRPVRARPDSAAYRARKFVARHRGAVAAAAAALVLLGWGLVRERTLRARAEAEAHKALAVKDYLVSVFDESDPFASPGKERDPTARALLDKGATRIDAALAGQPEVQAELLGVLGRVYVSQGVFDKAAPLLRRSLEQRRSLFGPRHAAVAEGLDQLGNVLARQNKFDEAEPLLREALAQRRALLGDANEATAQTLTHLATLLQWRNEYAGAETHFREALEVRREVHGPDHEEVASALNNLGVLLYLRGRYDEAEPLYRQALDIHERRLGAGHPQVAVGLQNLAQVQQLRGHFDEAESLHRRSLSAKRTLLGNAHPTVATSLNNLGMMLAVDKDETAEAESLILEALALNRQMFGDRHANIAESLHYHGTVLRLKGDFDQGLRVARQALEMNRSLFGSQHVRVAGNLNGIAVMLYLKGDLDAAIPVFKESLALYTRLVGEKHRNSAVVGISLAKALREKGDALEAEGLLRAASARLDPANREQRSHLIRAQVALGQALMDQGRHTEALPLLEQTSAMASELFGAGHWKAGEAGAVLGACLAATGEPARAETVLRQAYAALQARPEAQPRVVQAAAAAFAEVSRIR